MWRSICKPPQQGQVALPTLICLTPALLNSADINIIRLAENLNPPLEISQDCKIRYRKQAKWRIPLNKLAGIEEKWIDNKKLSFYYWLGNLLISAHRCAGREVFSGALPASVPAEF